MEGAAQANAQKYERGLMMSSLFMNLVKDQIVLPICISCQPYKQNVLGVGYQERLKPI